jgi:hypothetical protein
MHNLLIILIDLASDTGKTYIFNMLQNQQLTLIHEISGIDSTARRIIRARFSNQSIMGVGDDNSGWRWFASWKTNRVHGV